MLEVSDIITAFEDKIGHRVSKTTIYYMLKRKLFWLEVENRELKQKNMYIKQARFDVFKTYEGYSFDGIDIPMTIQPEDIIAVNFIDKK